MHACMHACIHTYIYIHTLWIPVASKKLGYVFGDTYFYNRVGVEIFVVTAHG